MSSASAKDSDLLPEYDFSKGVRGKYVARYRAGTNVIILDPDLVDRFPDSKAVNSALRTLVEVADRQVKSAPR